MYTIALFAWAFSQCERVSSRPMALGRRANRRSKAARVSARLTG